MQPSGYPLPRIKQGYFAEFAPYFSHVLLVLLFQNNAFTFQLPFLCHRAPTFLPEATAGAAVGLKGHS